MVLFDLRDLVKYPFLKEAQAYINKQVTSLDQYLHSPAGQKAIEDAYDTATRALFFNPRQPPKILPPIPSDSESVSILISSYPISRLMVSCSEDKALIDRLCRYQSWKVFQYLQEEEPEKKAVIARSLGIPHQSGKIPVILYIEIAARLQEERWRLVNRTVEKGMVTISSDEIDEIIRERLRVIMFQNLPHKVPSSLCLVFREKIEKLQQVYQQHMLEEFGSIEESAFPPCMQAIINALIQSSPLPHMGRFAITAFLHNIGMENNRIIELYGHVPNFDLTKTMYQVEHISGRGGLGTEYISPLCSTMKTYALCIHPDALCSKVTHPLTYYKQKKKMIKTTSSRRDIPDEIASGADDTDKQQ